MEEVSKTFAVFLEGASEDKILTIVRRSKNNRESR